MAEPITYLLTIILHFLIATHATKHSCTPNIAGGQIPAENIAKLHLYVQIVPGGPSPTAYEVARASITSRSPSDFGRVIVVDDLLTTEPRIDSEHVGRLQGILAYSDLETPAYTTNLLFYFCRGPYNGSTISVMGRIGWNTDQLDQESVIPIVGGTGVFRRARGYVNRSVYSYDGVTDYRALEYTIYITYVDDSSNENLDIL